MNPRAHPLLAAAGTVLSLSAWALGDAGEIGWRVIASGPAQAQQLTLLTQVPEADRGQPAQHFVAALLAGQWFCHGTQWSACSGAFPAYSGGALPSSLQLVLGTLDTQALAGTRIYAGYGSSFDEMLASRRYRHVYTVGRAPAVAWQAAQAVPAAAAASLAFNNTAVALRDDTGALNVVWEDGSNGWHGRHDGNAWRVTALPKAGSGSYAKPTLALLADGELLLAWAERVQNTVTIHATRSLAGRSRWEPPLTLASGAGLTAGCTLSAFRRPDGSSGAVIAWGDDGSSRVLARSWGGAAWSLSDWSSAASPAGAAAVPKDITLGGDGLVQWASWEDTRGGGGSEIYLARSGDGGRSWETELRLPMVAGSAIGGDPSVAIHPDGTLTVGFQRQNRVWAAQLADGGRTLVSAADLGPGLFAHVGANARSTVVVTWEHFSGGNLKDDSIKSVGSAIGLDQLTGVTTPHAMPDSATTLSAVQAAVTVSHDRIDVFWIDVSVAGQRTLRWRSATLGD